MIHPLYSEEPQKSLPGKALPATPSSSIDLVGEYAMKGWDPDEKSNYEGFAVITKQPNDVYQCIWDFGNKKFIGVGRLCCDDTISFVNIANEDDISLVVYTILGKTLKAKWVHLEHSSIGWEELEKR